MRGPGDRRHDEAVTTAPVPGTYPYHRLQATRPGWWRPLVVGLVALALYVALLLVGGILTVVVELAVGAEGPSLLERLATAEMRDPATLALLMLLIVAMAPPVLVATRLLGARPVGLLASVAGRVRWAWALRCALASTVVTVLVVAGQAAVDLLRGEEWRPAVDAWTWPLLGVVVLLVPLQSVAEEVVFRGFLAQTVGRWLRHPAFAIVLPVPLFVVAHEYVGLAAVEVGVWALAMGWLVWRTGGLEAAGVDHVVNNVVVFGLGAFGVVDLDAVETTVDGFAVSTVSTLVYVVVVEVMARRYGVARVRVVPPPAPAVVPTGAVGAPPADGPRSDPWAAPSARP